MEEIIKIVVSILDSNGVVEKTTKLVAHIIKIDVSTLSYYFSLLFSVASLLTESRCTCNMLVCYICVCSIFLPMDIYFLSSPFMRNIRIILLEKEKGRKRLGTNTGNGYEVS